MKISQISKITLLALVFIFTALIFSAKVFAVEDARKTKADLLTGKTWQLLSLEGKRAYVLGAGELAEIERELIAKQPHMQRHGFTEKFAEALEGVPTDEIVNGIDAFYSDHPDQLDVSVMTVIWDTMIKPKVGPVMGKPNLE